jgi:hypothetical protein
MLTLERTYGAQADADLRRGWPQLPEPLVLPWSELPVMALDGDTPWLYGPIERDPLTTARGHAVLPRREIRRLRKLVSLNLPFQRLAFAHELDPAGAACDLLPILRDGPRTCTDAVARALVGPQPVHPGLRRIAGVLDAVVRGTALRAVVGAAAVLDPILFGVVGMPDTTPGEVALWYPLAAWRW